MRSPTESPEPKARTDRPSLADGVKTWNKRLHYLTGLWLLLFVWLFCLSGLLLNHSTWNFAQFWENRRQSDYERQVVPPQVTGDLAQARALMEQLGVSGEIEWTASRNDTNRFDFRVSRPGHILEVKADFDRKVAKVHQIDLNLWGVARILHTFTGVRMDDSRNQRDWALTIAWALAMDAVAAGLVFMVLSSLYMWWDLRQKRIYGMIALTLGLLSCGLFCFGLKWLY